MSTPESVKKFNGRDTLLRVRDGNPIRTRSTASLPNQVYTPNRICSHSPSASTDTRIRRCVAPME